MSNSEWVGFVEVPGILLIRLMSRCNEKCLFCMVSDEIAESSDLNYESAVRRILSQPPGTLIEFFGGEPTIYPRFLELLRAARQHEYPCSIATNMRIFHSQKFTASVAELGAQSIYIRTSIYGHTAELHDHYTDTPGSYDQTLRGIRNVVDEGFHNQVNIVILRENYQHVVELTRQVASWGVSRIKFGNLIHLDTCASHAAPFPLIKPYLMQAIITAENLGLTVTVEKTPICVIGGRIDLLSTERRIYGSSRAFDDAGVCSGCLVRRWCDGVDRGYVPLFGFAGLERVDTIPVQAVKPIDADCQPQFLKMHCVAIEDSQPDASTIADLEQIWSRVAALHGDLAVFPRKFLREAVAVHS